MHCTSCSEKISDKAETCPKCGVRQYREKNFCATCGAGLKPNQEMCVQCGTSVRNNAAASSGSGMEPWIAGLLSFLITGLGQMIMGQGKKGALILVGSMILGFITLGMSIFITTPIAIIDAFLIAKKKKSGVPVGDWEFF
jgi:TM2 domain-containing membrane protein YozV/ribosomal protein L40E